MAFEPTTSTPKASSVSISLTAMIIQNLTGRSHLLGILLLTSGTVTGGEDTPVAPQSDQAQTERQLKSTLTLTCHLLTLEGTNDGKVSRTSNDPQMTCRWDTHVTLLDTPLLQSEGTIRRRCTDGLLRREPPKQLSGTRGSVVLDVSSPYAGVDLDLRPTGDADGAYNVTLAHESAGATPVSEFLSELEANIGLARLLVSTAESQRDGWEIPVDRLSSLIMPGGDWFPRRGIASSKIQRSHSSVFLPLAFVPVNLRPNEYGVWLKLEGAVTAHLLDRENNDAGDAQVHVDIDVKGAGDVAHESREFLKAHLPDDASFEYTHDVALAIDGTADASWSNASERLEIDLAVTLVEDFVIEVSHKAASTGAQKNVRTVVHAEWSGEWKTELVSTTTIIR